MHQLQVKKYEKEPVVLETVQANIIQIVMIIQLVNIIRHGCGVRISTNDRTAPTNTRPPTTTYTAAPAFVIGTGRGWSWRILELRAFCYLEDVRRLIVYLVVLSNAAVALLAGDELETGSACVFEPVYRLCIGDIGC